MNATDTLALRFARRVIREIADEASRTVWIERHVAAELHDRVWHYINLHYAATYVGEAQTSEDRTARLERIAAPHRAEVLRMGRGG